MKKFLGNEHYWWFCANPSICSASEWEIGTTRNHTWYNEFGNRRRVFPNFCNAKVGEITVFYESSPTKAVVALAIIVAIEPFHTITFRKLKNIKPISYRKIKDTESLKDMQFLSTPNGSFFKLTPSEYQTLCDLAEESN